MKLMRMHSALALTVAGTLAFGCSGSGDDDTGTVNPPDSGVVVTTDGGGTPDTGVVDACGDGVCDGPGGETFVTCPADCDIPDPCPDGEEGCECNSTWTDTDPAFLQDDCDADLLCVPWDTLSGLQDLTGPLQSCVKPCVADADCGAGRACGSWPNFADTTGVGRFCVDELAEADKFCGTTKLTTSRVSGVTVETGDRMVGCGTDTECIFGLTGFHIDEGVCLQFCGRNGDPACGGTTPYCNPELFTQTATDGTTINVGVCSVGQLGVGSWCGTEDPDALGFINVCDTSAQTAGDVRCVGLGLPLGNCMELCDTTATPPVACEGTDATQGDLYCADGLLQSGGGICMHNNCNVFPDTCEGMGAEGNGRFCFPFTMEGDGLCFDRRSPTLANGAIDSAGGVAMMGDDCRAEDLGFTQCPDNTACIGLQGGGGSCVIGCATADNAFCEGALMDLGVGSSNATCAAVFMDPANGICGGD